MNPLAGNRAAIEALKQADLIPMRNCSLYLDDEPAEEACLCFGAELPSDEVCGLGDDER